MKRVFGSFMFLLLMPRNRTCPNHCGPQTEENIETPLRIILAISIHLTVLMDKTHLYSHACTVGYCTVDSRKE